MIGCDKCGVTADTKYKLRRHKESQHPVEPSSSSERSLPRKKPAQIVEVKNINEAEVNITDKMDCETSDTNDLPDSIAKDKIIRNQANTIEKQADAIKKLEENMKSLVQKTNEKVTPNVNFSNKKRPIPNHLTAVKEEHLKDLAGYKMKCDGNPGGDCLSSCTTIHLSNTKDGSERRRVNQRVNHHIADHFDTYYCNKISLPYSETVGVGSSARQVTCTNREELLQFLRSESSLCAYSNSQELLAICNMLNIKIHIFTYAVGGDETKWSWNTVCPDPEMTQYADFPPGAVPDMYLYNSDNCHFDLLVADNSRLAVLGLISMEGASMEIKEKVFQVEEKGSKGVHENKVHEGGKGEVDDQWKTVQGSKNPKIHVKAAEKKPVLADSDEKVLTKHKQNGHKRDGPHSSPLKQKEQDSTVNLEAHMESLKVTEFSCDKCQDTFSEKESLENHMKNRHSLQWNCDQCDFQANTRVILMNHCKLAQGHQPSKQNQRLGQTGVIKCYTCNGEFRSYHNLMSHRKEEHPSHKKCRYYLKGECAFSSEDCWYLHEDKVSNANSSPNNVTEFQCFVCKNTFMSKYDLMQHKRKHHPSKIPCTKFQNGTCDRSAEDCNYKHILTTTNETSNKITANSWAPPLHKVQQQDFQRLPPTEAPDQATLVRALHLLNQRLQSLEERMFPKLG